VSCFLNALKNEPNNLDTLLALGISCTNILDEVKAMNFLKQWMMKNPKYNSLLEIDPNIVPDDQTIYDFSMDQIKQMSFRMLSLYEDAMKVDPNDPDLLVKKV
jgi:peroxin-5